MKVFPVLVTSIVVLIIVGSLFLVFQIFFQSQEPRFDVSPYKDIADGTLLLWIHHYNYDYEWQYLTFQKHIEEQSDGCEDRYSFFSVPCVRAEYEHSYRYTAKDAEGTIGYLIFANASLAQDRLAQIQSQVDVSEGSFYAIRDDLLMISPRSLIEPFEEIVHVQYLPVMEEVYENVVLFRKSDLPNVVYFAIESGTGLPQPRHFSDISIPYDRISMLLEIKELSDVLDS